MRGATLVESLISIFMFCAALLLVCNLFHAGMQYNRRADERLLAVRLAQNKLDEIVAWARTGSGTSYNYDDWSAYDGATGTFPEAPQFRYEVQVEDQVLENPCSSFNLVALSTRKKSVGAKRVHVRVWSSGPPLEVSTLVGGPARALAAPALVVTPVGSPPVPLPKDSPATFQVQALDQGGQPVPDVTFQWYLKPATGSGTLTQTFLGDQGTLTNVIQLPLHPPAYTGGTCQLRVRARYAGRDHWAETAPISLEGP